MERKRPQGSVDRAPGPQTADCPPVEVEDAVLVYVGVVQTRKLDYDSESEAEIRQRATEIPCRICGQSRIERIGQV